MLVTIQEQWPLSMPWVDDDGDTEELNLAAETWRPLEERSLSDAHGDEKKAVEKISPTTGEVVDR